MPALLKPFLLSVALLGALAGCGSSDDAADAAPPPPAPDPITRTVLLSGAQEVPAVLSAANGKGSLTLDRATGALSGSVTLDGVSATSAHIHDGAAGSNGAVLVTLSESTPGVWSVPANTVLNATQMAGFASGTLYVNAHSAAQAAGEVRGQIGMEVYHATLSGKHEVPADDSVASGTGMVVLDPLTRTISGSIKLNGLSATMAHIHLGAAGTNGGVAVNLAEAPAGSGTWVVPAGTVLTEAQVSSLRAGELYFNAHSAARPAGEVRGQIGRQLKTATLNGGHEVPASGSAATGSGWLAVDPNTRAATGAISFSGLSATMAHVHLGAAGTNGGVAINLVPGAAANSYRVPDNTVLSAAQYGDFLNNRLYFNVHSAAFPGGEIRGQIDNDEHHH